MAQGRWDETIDPASVGGLAAEELAPLRECVQGAFGLAKAGASSRGYRLLREGREQTLANLAPDDPRSRELLRLWDAVLRWYELFAPAPL